MVHTTVDMARPGHPRIDYDDPANVADQGAGPHEAMSPRCLSAEPALPLPGDESARVRRRALVSTPTCTVEHERVAKRKGSHHLPTTRRPSLPRSDEGLLASGSVRGVNRAGDHTQLATSAVGGENTPFGPSLTAIGPNPGPASPLGGQSTPAARRHDQRWRRFRGGSRMLP